MWAAFSADSPEYAAYIGRGTGTARRGLHPGEGFAETWAYSLWTGETGRAEKGLIMAEGERAELGAVQETLFIPLAARARETRKRRPVLRDPKAVHMVDSIDFDTSTYGRGVGGLVTILRTATFDVWVRNFLARNPAGTVVELGTGLNTVSNASTTAPCTGSTSICPTRSGSAGGTSPTPNGARW